MVFNSELSLVNLFISLVKISCFSKTNSFSSNYIFHFNRNICKNFIDIKIFDIAASLQTVLDLEHFHICCISLDSSVKIMRVKC